MWEPLSGRSWTSKVFNTVITLDTYQFHLFYQETQWCIIVFYRLKEVLSLRTLHKQLSQLLSLSEQDEMKMSKSFEPFDKSIPTQYSPYTEPLWRAAVSQFENSLAPAGKYLL